jgi:hypothetical protein
MLYNYSSTQSLEIHLANALGTAASHGTQIENRCSKAQYVDWKLNSCSAGKEMTHLVSVARSQRRVTESSHEAQKSSLHFQTSCFTKIYSNTTLSPVSLGLPSYLFLQVF